MPGFVVSDSDRKLINSKYICSCCAFVLKNPVQTLCGHFYCFSCIDDLKEPNRRDYRCVKDNVWFTKEEIFFDRCVQREVDSLPIHCPRQDCKWKGLIAQFEEHMSSCKTNEISEKYGGCVYEIVGCKVPKTLTAEQLKEHNEKCADFHLKLILNYVRESSPATLIKKIDNVTEQVNEQANKITRLEEATRGSWGSDTGALLRRLINTENSNANFGLLIVELNTTINELNGKIDQLEKHRENDAKTITALKNKLEMNDETPRNFPSTSQTLDQLPPCDGILLWKITDFARKRNDALTNQKVSFCSPPFYSDRYGYKMCARIYLNGDGMGRGQYISLFFVVMRGEYDALLRWPFRQKVTMMLLDQNHVEHVIDAFKPDPTSSSFKRPMSAMNIASGCPMFCPLADLDKYAYIKDDTMFVKIIVDTSEIF